MKMNILFVVLAVTALLVFGCTGSGDLAEQKSMDEKTTGMKDKQGDNADNSGASGVVNALLGKSYSELAALGVPLECDIKATDSGTGKEMTMKLYMKGDDFKTVADIEQVEGSVCKKFVSIYSNKVVYMGCEGGGEMIKGCQWVKFDTSKVPEGKVSDSSVSSATTADDLGKIPQTDISCKPGLFGAEIFAPTGKTCDLAEMFGDLGAMTSDYGAEDGAMADDAGVNPDSMPELPNPDE